MKLNRQVIFDKYGGRCAYCGIELSKGWHVDHLKPVVRFEGKSSKPENENFDNLMPSCPSCNTQKNSFTLEEFRFNIKHFVHSLNEYSTQYKFAKRYGLIKETGINVKFYFEEK